MAELDATQQRLANAQNAVDGAQRTRQVRGHGIGLVRALHALLHTTRVHAPGNQAFKRPVADFQQSCRALIELVGVIHLVAVEDQIYVNDVRLRFPLGSDAGSALTAELRRHRVGGMDIHTVPDSGSCVDLAVCFADTPEATSPRAALQAVLDEAGLDGIVLHGLHRFQTGDEVRSAAALARQASRLLDRAWSDIEEGRIAEILPLRRVVLAILESGDGAEGLWDEPDGASPYAAHTLRVCRLAFLIGREAGLMEEAMQDLGVAALLHDVGYAAREGATAGSDGNPGDAGYPPPFERHSTAGGRLLLRQPGLSHAKVRRALAALHHHRAYDSSLGRPSLFGRILHLAEDYDTLTRADGGGMNPAEALRRIAAEAGRRYDAPLCQLLVNRLGAYPPGTVVELSDGRLGQSISLCSGQDSFRRPRVRILRQPDGRTLPQAVEVDLCAPGAPQVARIVG